MIRTNDVESSLRLEIGKRLANVRDYFNLHQSEIAEKIGVSARSYQNYEQGKRELPSSLLFNLHEAFGVSTHWVLTGSNGPFYVDPAKIARKAMEDIAEVSEAAALSPDLKKIPDILEILIEQEMALRGLSPDELERLLKLASDKK
ncbi:helix-turn-helix domain-containing protein [Yoonia maritima]|uniref:helix-turn-helix domain-containing protein n=1 Tax=Yoonia maritima TaxID=1435347 RepID=UPI000D10F463|nr:helix-turn-helix transcriptional regulator [Yoonia maritima]